MSGKKFHLSWFMNFSPDEWDTPLGNGGSPWDGQFYVDMAKALDKAMVIEDVRLIEKQGGKSGHWRAAAP